MLALGKANRLLSSVWKQTMDRRGSVTQQSTGLSISTVRPSPLRKPLAPSLIPHHRGWGHCIFPGLSSPGLKLLEGGLSMTSLTPFCDCFCDYCPTSHCGMLTPETLKCSCSVSSDCRNSSLLNN